MSDQRTSNQLMRDLRERNPHTDPSMCHLMMFAAADEIECLQHEVNMWRTRAQTKAHYSAHEPKTDDVRLLAHMSNEDFITCLTGLLVSSQMPERLRIYLNEARNRLSTTPPFAGWIVQEQTDGSWRRHALSHVWQKKSDARVQLDELMHKNPTTTFRLVEHGAAEPPKGRRCLAEGCSEDSSDFCPAHRCWPVETPSEPPSAELTQVGEMIDVDDGQGTCIVDIPIEMRDKMPGGTKLYARLTETKSVEQP